MRGWTSFPVRRGIHCLGGEHYPGLAVFAVGYWSRCCRTPGGPRLGGIWLNQCGYSEIAWAAQMACLIEVTADKPGHVTPSAGFSDAGIEDLSLIHISETTR